MPFDRWTVNPSSEACQVRAVTTSTRDTTPETLPAAVNPLKILGRDRDKGVRAAVTKVVSRKNQHVASDRGTGSRDGRRGPSGERGSLAD